LDRHARGAERPLPGFDASLGTAGTKEDYGLFETFGVIE
jgi:hypothetical protein